MTLSPALRKLSLTAHVVSSIGWLGAVAAFLALAVVARTSDVAETVRSAYVSMNVIGLVVLVPLSLAALLTGLIQSLGTSWGLFRHYWVAAKFAITVVATALLLLHQFTAVASGALIAASTPSGELPDVGGIGTQLVADAALGLVALLVNATLSVFKPWGMTPYGRRTQQSELQKPRNAGAPGMPIGVKLFLAIVGLAIAAFIVLHLLDRGLHGHGG